MTKFGVVAMIGRPNAGKSTLLNHLMKQKISIVSDKPQTTRNQIFGILTESDIQIVFVDLPGFHKPLFEMNKAMMQNLYDSLDSCDLILYMLDASIALGRGETYLLEQLKPRCKDVVVALNKIDSIKKSRVLPFMERFAKEGFEAVVPISALTGTNVDQLMDIIRDRLPEGEFQYSEEDYTNISERFYVSEIIREKILQETRQEIPYCTFVDVRVLKDEETHVEIMADIAVERKSQKPILVGHQANMVKKIRKMAEKELKAYFEKPVDLELFVVVKENWRQKPRFMDRFKQ
ncbi:MAG: GTPase Era [Acidobacteria bacterium]|nr:MAG: GTPase Era [Acidobacteriota bacterium]